MTYEYAEDGSNKEGSADTYAYFIVEPGEWDTSGINIDDRAITDTTITYRIQGAPAGAELEYAFSADAGAWTAISGNTFTAAGLSPATRYDLYVRVRSDADHAASRPKPYLGTGTAHAKPDADTVLRIGYAKELLTFGQGYAPGGYELYINGAPDTEYVPGEGLSLTEYADAADFLITLRHKQTTVNYPDEPEVGTVTFAASEMSGAKTVSKRPGAPEASLFTITGVSATAAADGSITSENPFRYRRTEIDGFHDAVSVSGGYAVPNPTYGDYRLSLPPNQNEETFASAMLPVFVPVLEDKQAHMYVLHYTYDEVTNTNTVRKRSERQDSSGGQSFSFSNASDWATPPEGFPDYEVESVKVHEALSADAPDTPALTLALQDDETYRLGAGTDLTPSGGTYATNYGATGTTRIVAFRYVKTVPVLRPSVVAKESGSGIEIARNNDTIAIPGVPVTINAPTITGYVLDTDVPGNTASVTKTFTSSSDSHTFYYKRDLREVTVKAVDKSGADIAAPASAGRIRVGDTVSVNAPVIKYYELDPDDPDYAATKTHTVVSSESGNTVSFAYKRSAGTVTLAYRAGGGAILAQKVINPLANTELTAVLAGFGDATYTHAALPAGWELDTGGGGQPAPAAYLQPDGTEYGTDPSTVESGMTIVFALAPVLAEVTVNYYLKGTATTVAALTLEQLQVGATADVLARPGSDLKAYHFLDGSPFKTITVSADEAENAVDFYYVNEGANFNKYVDIICYGPDSDVIRVSKSAITYAYQSPIGVLAAPDLSGLGYGDGVFVGSGNTETNGDGEPKYHYKSTMAANDGSQKMSATGETAVFYYAPALADVTVKIKRMVGEAQVNGDAAEWVTGTAAAYRQYTTVTVYAPILENWQLAAGEQNPRTVSLGTNDEEVIFAYTPVLAANNALLRVSRDGEAWPGSGKKYALYRDGEEKYAGEASGGDWRFANVLNGTYDIYDVTTETPEDTGKTVTVASNAPEIDMNYFTVKATAVTGGLAKNASVSATYGGESLTAINEGAVVLGGKTLTLTASASGADKYAYAWADAAESSPAQSLDGRTLPVISVTVIGRIDAQVTVSGVGSVTLTVTKDGEAYLPPNTTFNLRQGGAFKYAAVPAPDGGDFKAKFEGVAAGTYDVYAADGDTGFDAKIGTGDGESPAVN